MVTTYDYDANDRLLSQGGTSYSYDDNGNTLAEISGAGSTSYVWDARNRLVEAATPAGTLLYGYDINGIRTSRSEGGVTTNFVVDHNQQYAQVLAETESGVTTKEYTYGDDLLSQTAGTGQERFFLYDGLGTTRALADGAEAVTDTYAYEAFGELLASTGSSDNAYRYTGEQYDSGLDQYYLRARYYDQGVGRFTQMDTWQGRLQEPVTLHKYLYGNADPVRYVDPSGYLSTIGSELSALEGLATLSRMAIMVDYGTKAVTAAILAAGAYSAHNSMTESNTQCKGSDRSKCRTLPTISYGAEMPNITDHIRYAQLEGRPNILQYKNRAGNRPKWEKLGISGCTTAEKGESGFANPSCDEYPFWKTTQGGPSQVQAGAVSLRWVPISEQRRQGGYMRNFLSQCGINTATRAIEKTYRVIADPSKPTQWYGGRCPK